MREDRSAKGFNHTLECRLRVEQAMRDAGDPRVKRAEDRITAAAEAALAAGGGPVLAGGAGPSGIRRGPHGEPVPSETVEELAQRVRDGWDELAQ